MPSLLSEYGLILQTAKRMKSQSSACGHIQSRFQTLYNYSFASAFIQEFFDLFFAEIVSREVKEISHCYDLEKAYLR